MIKKISSTANPEIKEYIKILRKSNARKQSGYFLVEGVREIDIAIRNNYFIKKIIYNPVLINFDKVKKYIKGKTECIETTNNVYKKISYRSSTEGLIALVEKKNHNIDTLKIKNRSPLILILDGIEKPGNIGALLRTSDAANIDAVFIINQKTDLYNANIIRSSIGCLFSNNIILTTTEKTIEYLKENNIKIFSSFLKASKNYQEINYNEGCAIVLGSEDKGISKKWLDESHELIYIPMQGNIDSLNVSNSGAIIIYEAKRQRNFK
tara:strand:- start:1104 stop:1901 length:798 start_codon:yes stop_codon:yes gene_type:complete